jgi:hypothetical protein
MLVYNASGIPEVPTSNLGQIPDTMRVQFLEFNHSFQEDIVLILSTGLRLKRHGLFKRTGKINGCFLEASSIIYAQFLPFMGQQNKKGYLKGKL